MEAYEKDDRLIIRLAGRIHSVNAEQTGSEIDRILAEHPGKTLCLDAEKLEYISSSGLRILIRLCKSLPEKLMIRNVPAEIYDIFSVSGLTSIMQIEKKRRQISVAGCEVLGEGAFGTVYRLDEDTVVKVYRNGEKSLPIIQNEQEKARQAFLSGIPTAIPVDIVQVGDQYGSMFEMINAQNCNEIIVRDPGQLPGMISEYAAFQKKLHSLETKPGELENARDIYLRNLTVFGDVLPAAIRERLEALLRKMPDDYHLIHGDIQMKNVMKSGDEMVLIDMDKICTGNPVFEFASLYTTYVLFSEDNPMDNQQFLGISRETADRIYYETLQCYLDHPEESKTTETQRRIRLAAYLRFMTILMIEMKDVQSELRTIRIRHTIEHLKELTFEVDELQI